MKNITNIYILFALILVTSCTTTEKKQKVTVKKDTDKFYINGHTSVKTDSIFLLDKNGTRINSASIKNNSFKITGKANTPKIAFLQLKNQQKKYAIVLENETFNVISDNYSMKILGGKTNNILSSYLSEKQYNQISKSKFHEQFSAKKTDLKTFLRSIDSIRRKESTNLLKFIKDNANNGLSLFMLKQHDLSSTTLKKLQADLANSTNEELTKYISSLIEETKVAEAKEKIENRPKAFEFSGTNLDGRITTLSKVMRGKKAVLIDFWASWCSPCRALSPSIKRIYNQYKNKGFDIITVSQDRSVNAWEVGVYDDGMEEWNHIYDENGYVAALYAVRAIPHMVLLDDKGRIVKNKISITELKEQLAKMLD